LRERECGFDGEADGAEACGVEGVKCWDWGNQKFECEEGNEEVEEELPVSANLSASTRRFCTGMEGLTVYETAIAKNYTVLESRILCLLLQRRVWMLLLLSKMGPVGGRELLSIAPIESRS
jgi:hypothetical protein